MISLFIIVLEFFKVINILKMTKNLIYFDILYKQKQWADCIIISESYWHTIINKKQAEISWKYFIQKSCFVLKVEKLLFVINCVQKTKISVCDKKTKFWFKNIIIIIMLIKIAIMTALHVIWNQLKIKKEKKSSSCCQYFVWWHY